MSYYFLTKIQFYDIKPYHNYDANIMGQECKVRGRSSFPHEPWRKGWEGGNPGPGKWQTSVCHEPENSIAGRKRITLTRPAYHCPHLAPGGAVSHVHSLSTSPEEWPTPFLGGEAGAGQEGEIEIRVSGGWMPPHTHSPPPRASASPNLDSTWGRGTGTDPQAARSPANTWGTGRYRPRCAWSG